MTMGLPLGSTSILNRRMTCDLAPKNWKCIRDLGHDGPCAAAPLTGSQACPDIDRCIANGCRAKCGPDETREAWRLTGTGQTKLILITLLALVAVFGLMVFESDQGGAWRTFAGFITLKLVLVSLMTARSSQ